MGCAATAVRAQCGNGSLELGEQCDDGNTVSGDGCSGLCLIEAADAGTLSLEIAGSCVTATNGQIAVQLWMRNLVNGNASGFQAFIAFDDNQLDYLGGASSYTSSPFPLHIQPIASAQTGVGKLRLDGTATFNSNGTNQDALLATLVFQINVQCSSTAVAFDTGGPFASELSYEGFPVPTTLAGTPNFSLDNTPPVLMVPPNTTVSCTVNTNLPANTGGAASASDNCSVPTVSFSDSTTPGACPQERTITRTWTATDACGNSSSANQTIAVDDSTPPVISGPGNIIVNAAAGGCTAVVTYSVTAGDDCDASVTPTCMPASGSTFPSGTTTVNCSATDDCGNTSMQSFTVTVNPVNNVTADVVLAGVNAGAGLSRCIKFVARGGGMCAAAQHVTVMFTGNPASGTASFTVPCGSYTSLCAKDEQHTLYDTHALTIVGTSYVSNSTPSPLTLLAGDTDNDSDVDINDVTLLITQFGGPEPAGGCPWSSAARGGDFSDNGNVGSEDYSLLAPNWLAYHACDCAAPQSAPPPERVRTRLAVSELAPEVALRADLNGDGVIDSKDVAEFERRHGLSSALSDAIKKTEAAQRNGHP
jgi:cysteine-rich repeat protein